jgi:hypothetical protein
MATRTRLGLIAGTTVSPLIAIVLVAVTLSERDFLKMSRWSAVHRSSMEWPSLLALGRYGAAVLATFALAGLLVIVFAAALCCVAVSTGERAAGLIIVVAGIALALEAFPADDPGVAHESWHAHIHNAVYPLIPTGLVAAAFALAVLGRNQTRRPLQRASRLALPIFVFAIVMTLFGSIAQLGRYFLFGAALAWLEAIALPLVRRAS